MSFGFSVGDVLVCSKLAYNAYTALKDAPKEFESLRLEVLSLNATLRALAEEADSPNSIILLASPQRQESLRILLENCSKGLQQLQILTKKFPSLGSSERIRFLEHVRFSVQDRKGPRDKLAIHTASINIFLTSLTHSSLGRLESLIKNALREKVPIASATTAFTSFGTKSISSNGGNVWLSIGQDLALEGIQDQQVELLKDELVAYARHLANGGEPFWKRGASRADTAPPSYQRPSSESGYGRPQSSQAPYNRTGSADHRQYEPASPAYSPVEQAPPQYSANSGSNRTSLGPNQEPLRPQGTGHYRWDSNGHQTTQTSQTQSGGNSEPNSNPAGSNPLGYFPVGLVYGSPESGPTGAGTNNRPNSASPQQNLPQTSGWSQQPPATIPAQSTPHNTDYSSGGASYGRPPNQPSYNHPMQHSNLSAPNVYAPVAELPGHQPPQQGTGSFGSPSNSSQPGFGAPAGSSQVSTNPFGKPAFGSGTGTATGALFGSSADTGQTSTGFGAFGQPPQYISPWAQQPPVNTRELSEMEDLFDALFDIDETVPAIAQGAPLTEPYNPISHLSGNSEMLEKVTKPLVPSPSPAPGPVPDTIYPSYVISPPLPPKADEPRKSVPTSKRTTPSPGKRGQQKASNHSILTPGGRRIVPSPAQSLKASNLLDSMPVGLLPPPLTQGTPDPLRQARLKSVRTQLEALISQVETTRADNAWPIALFHDPSPEEAPIPIRVKYLREAGIMVVNCDLCHTPVLDSHWHCDVCAGGDWDCCLSCKEGGRSCPRGHALEKRSAREWAIERYWTTL